MGVAVRGDHVIEVEIITLSSELLSETSGGERLRRDCWEGSLGKFQGHTATSRRRLGAGPSPLQVSASVTGPQWISTTTVLFRTGDGS